MHGADRIGGLSSANGLVFGRIAGKGAANHGTATSVCINADSILKESLERIRMSAAPLDDMDASRITKDMQGTMSAHAMIQRSEEGLATALDDIERLRREARYHGDCRGCVIPADAALARGIRVSSQLKLAQAMLQAMRNRTEGLGSHYRAD